MKMGLYRLGEIRNLSDFRKFSGTFSVDALQMRTYCGFVIEAGDLSAT
jgi:hypothetical protein